MARIHLFALGALTCLLALTAGLLFAGGTSAAPSSANSTTVQRTFVSTSGSDSNPCSNTQPCRSFATALTRTTAGGEVVALTSGGYGPVGIGMAVTLVGAPGVHAAITVSTGNGIEINAGGVDTVVLRNLYVNGLGGTHGIVYNSGGALHLEQITVTGFRPGIGNSGVRHLAPGGSLHASDLSVRRNNIDVLVSPASGTAPVTLDRVQARENGQDGIWGHQNARLRVSDCVASGNDYGIYSQVPTMVSNCQLSENSHGFLVGSSVGRIGGSTVTGNVVGLNNSGGTLESFGDNLVRGNTSGDTFGTITLVGKS